MNWFKRRRLQPALVMLLSSLVLVLMLLEGLVFYSSTSDLLSRKISEASLRELEQLNSGMEQNMRSIQSAALAIAINPDIIRILSPGAQEEAYAQLRNSDFATRILSNLTNSRNDISESYIITDRMSIFNYSNPNALYDKERAMTQSFWRNMDGAHEGFIPPRDNDIRTDGSGGRIITYFRKLSLPSGTELGYICINVKADRFLSAQIGGGTAARERIYISDGQSGMFAPDGGERENVFASVMPSSASLDGNGYRRFEREGSEYLGTYTKPNAFGWRIVEIRPYEEVMSGINQVLNRLLIVVVACFLLAVAASVFFARSFTLPIKRLIHQMKKVGQGDFDIAIDTTYTNEIGELNHRFMLMSRRIEQLMANIEREQQQIRRTELRTLQSQINPHFLYNTLDAINWMAIRLKASDISRMASNLGDYLRLSLNKGQETTAIQAEIEHLRSYVQIMAYRYGGRFDYREQMDPIILPYRIPKIILQPLVENSFIHGLGERKGEGSILVVGCMEGEDVVFTVTDDGAGADPAALNAALQQSEPSFGYGIHNVNQRIRLRYGARYGLAYEAVERGTRAILRLPPEPPAIKEETKC